MTSSKRRILNAQRRPSAWWLILVLTVAGGNETHPSAALAGSDAVVVIAHAGNPVSDLSMAQLALIYQGRKHTWGNGQTITPVNRATDTEARRIFYKRVLRSKPAQKFFLPGSPVPLSLMVRSSALEVKQFVADAPGALGYLLLSELGTDTDGVKVLSIDGVLPNRQTVETGSYKLQEP